MITREIRIYSVLLAVALVFAFISWRDEQSPEQPGVKKVVVVLDKEPEGQLFAQLAFVVGENHFRLAEWAEAVEPFERFVARYVIQPVDDDGKPKGQLQVTKVPNLDTALKRFNVGTLVVDYATATLEDFGSTGIESGVMVEVKGTSFLADGALHATRVQREGHGFDGHSGDDSEIEGLVTRFGSGVRKRFLGSVA